MRSASLPRLADTRAAVFLRFVHQVLEADEVTKRPKRPRLTDDQLLNLSNDELVRFPFSFLRDNLFRRPFYLTPLPRTLSVYVV